MAERCTLAGILVRGSRGAMEWPMGIPPDRKTTLPLAEKDEMRTRRT